MYNVHNLHTVQLNSERANDSHTVQHNVFKQQMISNHCNGLTGLYKETIPHRNTCADPPFLAMDMVYTSNLNFVMLKSRKAGI